MNEYQEDKQHQKALFVCFYFFHHPGLQRQIIKKAQLKQQTLRNGYSTKSGRRKSITLGSKSTNTINPKASLGIKDQGVLPDTYNCTVLYV